MVGKVWWEWRKARRRTSFVSVLLLEWIAGKGGRFHGNYRKGMSATKGERRLAIWVGVAIGVAASSLLVRHAFQVKEEQAANRPGNYDSLQTALGGLPFAPVPAGLREKLPNGVVVHYEENASTGLAGLEAAERAWVVETTGAFRSERLFVLVEEVPEQAALRFSRASELYLTARAGVKEEAFEEALDGERFRILGRNEATGDFLMQIREFHPEQIRRVHEELRAMTDLVASTRPAPY